MSNPVMYFEIGCRDTAKAEEFYKGLFEWDVKSSHIDTGKAGIGGHFQRAGP